MDATIEHDGRDYEVRLSYERLDSDGGPGWVVEDVRPEPRNRDVFYDVVCKAEKIAVCEAR